MTTRNQNPEHAWVVLVLIGAVLAVAIATAPTWRKPDQPWRNFSDVCAEMGGKVLRLYHQRDACIGKDGLIDMPTNLRIRYQ